MWPPRPSIGVTPHAEARRPPRWLCRGGLDDDLTPSLRGFIDASMADGYKHVDDFNGADPEGAGGCPVNIVDGVRQSSAVAYLTDEVRRRPNLTIVGKVVVDKVLFDGI